MRNGLRPCLLLGLYQMIPAVLGYDSLSFPLLLCEFSRTVVDFFYLSPSNSTLTLTDQMLLLYTHPTPALLKIPGLPQVCAGRPRHPVCPVKSTTLTSYLRYVFLPHLLRGFSSNGAYESPISHAPLRLPSQRVTFRELSRANVVCSPQKMHIIDHCRVLKARGHPP